MLGLPAHSRPSTFLGARRSDLAPPTQGASSRWALLRHPDEGRAPSKTALYYEGRLLGSPYLR
eukprot:381973-Lingulodinium_polyedra.AAC.1